MNAQATRLANSSRRRLSEPIVTFRCTSGPSPLNLSTLFKPAVSVHQHSTRSASSNSLYPPRVSIEFGKKSFAFRAAQLWNLLPPNLRQTKNPDVFMSMARSHFLSFSIINHTYFILISFMSACC